MKNLNGISPGNYVILSDTDMKNLIAGSGPGLCDPHGETCGGSCIGTLNGGQPVEPIEKGTCRIYYGEWYGTCTCMSDERAG